MTKFFDKIFTRYPIKTKRMLEMLPGSVSWFLIFFPFWGSIFFPYIVAYFILMFDVYWFYRSFWLVITSYIASQQIRRAERKNWLEKSNSLGNFSKLHHIVIIPNYQENVEKLARLINTIKDQTFPLKRVHVVLAMEKREKDRHQKANRLLSEFKGVFGGIYATFHPDILGEVKGKSSNEAYAGKWIYKKIIKNGPLDIDFVTVTTADADTCFDSQYLSYLTYSFLKDNKRHNNFWQSATVDHNNFWTVPAPNRIFSFFSSLWRTGLLVQGDRLIATSTYSLSFKLLQRIGFWDTDVIPEDYRIFFKAFYKLGGDVKANPIFLRTSLDSPLSTTYIRSLKTKYHQVRRWSYGVSDDPLFIKWWFTVPNVPFIKKTKVLIHVLLDHFLWPVNWFVLTIFANLITLINPDFGRTALGYTLPVLARFILSSTIVALIIMVVIDYRNRPKNLSSSKVREVLFPLEFVLMPIVGFFLNALPAIISHTQIMLGKKMEYKVTEKL
ncbi:MAG: glycosyltransferase family 2 protein [Candidatus Levybacteria bacterium]|nr:glycosyltransferase family 2 protein [Candidatus Levybacteria bacterium]